MQQGDFDSICEDLESSIGSNWGRLRQVHPTHWEGEGLEEPLM